MKTTYGATNQILAFVQPTASLSVELNDTGVTADDHGQKIIPAGTPVGGSTQATDDENSVLSVANDATAQGVLLHDVNVTSGSGNGSLLIFGFVNLNRIPDVTVSDAAKTALASKVTFLKRN
ncbi:hypothetical protein [Loigolactobacillus backii]|uniref:hypothetical protein n=1 Tax=Loigolactobacillus backii TaxID=375175 RepID=UPI0007F071AD|nr:hypothetical protein [Loigolactobacillus backii]ANK59820.1 hypothetical protein AYR52_05825 [Loigolactobacillus backii]